jgi:CheY-like chemotaxis protein
VSVVTAVVTDIFFQARIASTVRAAGLQVRYELSVSGITKSPPTDLALVDLDADTDVFSVIRALRMGGTRTIIAFGPHVDTDRRKAAKAAGADRVMAKSKFVQELPRLVAALASAEATPQTSA